MSRRRAALLLALGTVLAASALALGRRAEHVAVRSRLQPLRGAPLDMLTSSGAALAVAKPWQAPEPAVGALEEAPRRPHPITPAHQRIFRENNLIGRLNAAVDLGDVGELRRLLAEYRAQYPEDAHALQEPYALIADCQENVTARARENARRYWNEHRSSTLRRYLRRHCLENEG